VNFVAIWVGLLVKLEACGGCFGGSGSLDFGVILSLGLNHYSFEEWCYSLLSLSKQKSIDSLVLSSGGFCWKT